MGMNVPDLDDREFEAVFEEAKRKIPVHTDEWTDHNRHDTGIAILEVLAWISETYTYQLDQISERDREKYLRLLGLERRPPTPATAELAASPPPSADGAVVPAGRQLSVDDRSGETKRFETLSDTTLITAEVATVLTRSGGDTVDNTTESRTENTHFYAFGEDPASGDAMYVGFDADPFAETDAFELRVEYHDAELPAPATHGHFEPTFEPSVAVEWEYCADYADWNDPDSWAPLPVRTDETQSLYDGGTVEFGRPPGWGTAVANVDTASVLGQPPGQYWIRCRLDTPGYEVPPRLDSLRTNVLEIGHRATIEDETLVSPDGTDETTVDSDQVFEFAHTPVLSARVEVDGERWTEVDDFDTSEPTDRHYVLDHQAGELRFGNGIDGAKPPVGEDVEAVQYVTGGGTDGNVTETDQWRFRRPSDPLTRDVAYEAVELRPLGPATGGTDAETPADVMDRFRRDFKESYRASTLENYEYVATHTPGLRFGRAYATSDGTATAAGATRDAVARSEIEVIVVPYSTREKPRPSEGFREAVATHLDRTRLLTDPVRIGEPTYVDVAVDVTVSELPGYSVAEVEAAVTDALVDYLDPIEGFDGDGWPFGHPLYVAEVREEVEALPSVRSVLDVGLSARGEENVDEYGNVYVDDRALLSLSRDEVTVSFGDEHAAERGY